MPPAATLPSGGNPSEPSIEIRLRPAGASDFAAVVRLIGEHDIATCPQVKDALAPISGNVLVDLSACEFIDSSVIGVLLGACQAREREGQRLELVVPPTNSMIMRTLTVAGVTQLLNVHGEMP